MVAFCFLTDGEEEKDMVFPNVYFRQFHPISAEVGCVLC